MMLKGGYESEVDFLNVSIPERGDSMDIYVKLVKTEVLGPGKFCPRM